MKKPKQPPQTEISQGNSPDSQSEPEDAAYVALLEGNTLPEVHSALRARFPGCNPDRVVRNAAKAFAQLAAQDRDSVRGWTIAAARDLYRKMVEIGDFAGALKALSLIDKFYTQRESVPGQSDINLDL